MSAGRYRFEVAILLAEWGNVVGVLNTNAPAGATLQMDPKCKSHMAWDRQ